MALYRIQVLVSAPDVRVQLPPRAPEIGLFGNEEVVFLCMYNEMSNEYQPKSSSIFAAVRLFPSKYTWE